MEAQEYRDMLYAMVRSQWKVVPALDGWIVYTRGGKRLGKGDTIEAALKAVIITVGRVAALTGEGRGDDGGG